MGEFDLEAFKASFASDKNAAVNDDLWKIFEETDAWSLWRCVYDYAEDNESVDATKEIVTSFMKNTESVKGQIFGVMHVLEPSLEVEGLFLCKGADPEFLFSANEDTSWFTWSQLGPSLNDGVKKEVTGLWAADGDYNGKKIAHTQSV